MRVEIKPGTLRGTIPAPPSKSMAHRALIAAALADGVSTVENVAPSEDLLATMDCLRALGASVEHDGNCARVHGVSPERFPDGAVLPCRGSGSTLRFLIPLTIVSGKEITFTGSKRLFERPLGVYEDICREQGLLFDRSDVSLTVRGRLTPGVCSVPGNVSSQFISGLAFALPLLAGDSVLKLVPPVESRPYVEMTGRVLGRFGVTAALQGDEMPIPGAQRYLPRDFRVEGDWSNAAFLLALNALGGQVEVTGLAGDSVQGDRVILPYLDALRSGAPTLDLRHCPDLGPVCMVLAAALNGAVFTGVRRLRSKESDRIASIASELAKCGVTAEIEADRVTIPGGALRSPCAPLDGHGDHRVVMALAVLSTVTGGVIRGAEAVSKSWPDFFHALRLLGADCTVSEGVNEHGYDL